MRRHPARWIREWPRVWGGVQWRRWGLAAECHVEVEGGVGLFAHVRAGPAFVSLRWEPVWWAFAPDEPPGPEWPA